MDDVAGAGGGETAMPDENDFGDDRVAREVYPIAVSQARAQVLIQLAVIVAFVLLWAVSGFPRQLVSTAGMIAAGSIATAYDIRWWLWLRRADPVEAYARVQARDDRQGGSLRSRLTLIASIGLLTLWWLVAD
jgi:hypothetical protein